MTGRLFAITLMAMLAGCVSQTAPALPPPDASDLLGTWDVALYFSPDAPPSATVLEISAVNEDGTLAGSFYQSPFETGRYQMQDGDIIISVITSDGSGPYATSGRLGASGGIDGQTLSTGRGFLMGWRAEKR